MSTTTSLHFFLCYFHIISSPWLCVFNFLVYVGLYIVSNNQHSETYQANDLLGSSWLNDKMIYWLSWCRLRTKGFQRRKKSGRRICCYGVRIFLVLHPFPSLLLLLIPLFVAVALLFSYLDKRQEKLRTEAAEASQYGYRLRWPNPTSHWRDGCGQQR